MIKEISDFVRLRTNSARGSQFSRQGDLPFENDSSLGASTGLSRRPWPTAEARSIALLREDNVLKHILAQVLLKSKKPFSEGGRPPNKS